MGEVIWAIFLIGCFGLGYLIVMGAIGLIAQYFENRKDK